MVAPIHDGLRFAPRGRADGRASAFDLRINGLCPRQVMRHISTSIATAPGGLHPGPIGTMCSDRGVSCGQSRGSMTPPDTPGCAVALSKVLEVGPYLRERHAGQATDEHGPPPLL